MQLAVLRPLPRGPARERHGPGAAVPPGGSAKNGADIRLCLDAMEDLDRRPHIGCIVVVGGDSDFAPLALKVRAAGRRIVGIGTRNATNRHWASACDAFHYYEDVVARLP
nr:NYN domain-containing protein [Ramlibacter montanisoli]